LSRTHKVKKSHPQPGRSVESSEKFPSNGGGGSQYRLDPEERGNRLSEIGGDLSQTTNGNIYLNFRGFGGLLVEKERSQPVEAP